MQYVGGQSDCVRLPGLDVFSVGARRNDFNEKSNDGVTLLPVALVYARDRQSGYLIGYSSSAMSKFDPGTFGAGVRDRSNGRYSISARGSSLIIRQFAGAN